MRHAQACPAVAFLPSHLLLGTDLFLVINYVSLVVILMKTRVSPLGRKHAPSNTSIFVFNQRVDDSGNSTYYFFPSCMRNITASLGYTYDRLVRKVSLTQICAAHKQASQFGPNLDQTIDRESPFYFARLAVARDYLYGEFRVMS